MYKWWVLLLLAGCNATPTTVTQNVYPNLPDVPALPALELKPVAVELPTEKSFVGLDYQNWANLQINLQTLKQYILEYQQRIAEVNQQRANWRQEK